MPFGTYNIDITATNPYGSDTETLVYTRTKKSLTLVGGTGQDREYDGTTDVTILTAPSLTGIVTGDVVSLTGTGTGNLANKKAISEQVIITGGYTLTGADAGNYNLTYPQSPTGLTVNIFQKQLTVTSLLADNKIYDGNTTATTTGTPTLSGTIVGDVVSLNSASATTAFINSNAGIAKTVNGSGYSLTGTDNVNYTLLQPVLSADITPKELTITGVQINNKVHDGNTSATISGTPVLVGIVNTDDVTLVATGATAVFTSPNIGTNIPVTVSGYSLSGADILNYTIQQPQGLTATISNVALLPQTITFGTLAGVSYGDADFLLTATSNSGLAVSYTSLDTSVATVSGNTVTVVGVGTTTITATQAGNGTYDPATPVSQPLTVNPKALTVINGAVADKTYDKTTTAQVTGTLSGIVGSENVTLTSAGTFTTDDAGNNIPVTPQFTISGTDVANYTLIQPTITGNILPKTLTITTPAATNKIYDGTTDAVITGTLTGKITGDVVTLNGTGTFAVSDKGTAIGVTANATLGGADAANYTLTQPTGLTANITALAITVNATASNKVYNGNTTTTITVNQINGLIINDDVSVTGNGTFTNSNAGVGKAVTGHLVLGGTDAANYTLTQPTGLTADITPLTITADITNATVNTKVYSNTNIAVIQGVMLNGVLPSDNNLQAVTGTFASVIPGVNIPVTITLTGAPAVNYILIQPNPLPIGTITKRPFNVVANNKTKAQGDVNPQLTFTWGSFASNENATTNLPSGFVSPTISTTADINSPEGTYPIILSGGSADYYDFTLVNGWLTVKPQFTPPIIQLLAWDFTGEDTVVTSTAEIKNVNLDSSGDLTRGPGANASTGGDSFRTLGFKNDGIAVTNTDYFQFTMSANTDNQLSLNAITAKFDGTTTFVNSNLGVVSHQFAYSFDGTNFTLVGLPTTTTSKTQPITVNVSGVTALQNIQAGTTVTFRYYASGQTNTGGWGFKSASVGDYGLSITGSITTAPLLPKITSTLTDDSVVGTTDSYQIIATGTPAVNLTATNLPVGATINNSGLISFDGTTPAGNYTIALTASSFYGTDTQNLVYTVKKKDQMLTFSPDPIPNKFLNDASFVVSVTNNVPLAVTLSSSDPTVATIAQDGTVTIVGAGTTMITASNTGDATYAAVSVGKSFTVLPAPVITATPSPISFTVIQGQGASTSTQLTSITAVNLLPVSGTITLTASTGFEIAMGIAPYSNTGSFTYTGAAVNESNPQIYVRFIAGQNVGNYTGTLTISGGSGTVQIPLTATVQLAPAITTTTTPIAAYCSGNATAISLPYTAQGTFGTGNFYVQHSDNTGIFPADFSNIISLPASASPISATLPATLTGGNYRVRVVHLSSGLVLTSSNNNNGSNIVINTTSAPTATALTFCGATTIANLTANGTSLKWYAAANGGTQLLATAAVTTGNYFVSQTLNNCESARTQVSVTVNITPAPTATALTFCGATTVANLTANGTSLKWYAAANGGTQLLSTATVTTGNYFVSQTLNNCESTRTQVAVTVNITPAPTATALTFCGATTVANLTANGTSLKWYVAANGGTQLLSTATVTTGNYFVSQTLNNCESTRTQVAVTVNVTPAPTATALTFCGATTIANLTANGTALKWYAAANGGTQLISTASVTTGNYFVSQTLNNCESTRTQVAVMVNITPAPTAPALTFCGATTVANLTANGTSLKWYAAANGGTQLISTASVTTGNYFVSQTLNNCESTRTQVVVTINITPAPTATALTFCGATTIANLTANGTSLKWYAAANGGTQLISTASVTTGNYFVSQTLNNCESTRTQVAVTVNITPAPTATALTFCGATTVANLTANGTSLKWYAAANGGTQLLSTANVTTGNYFVSQTLNNCESTRTQVAVTVNITPTPTATALTFCGATTVANLTANGTSLKWYATANGGTQLLAMAAVTTGNYFVSQTLNNCESTRTQVAVTVNITPAPTAIALTFCGATTVANLTANATSLKWYAAANGGTQLIYTASVTTGNYFVSQTLNNCESIRTQVSVTVNITPAPTATALTFCGATTVANLTANGTSLKWYAAANGSTQLISTASVTTGNYFVSQTLNNCESTRTQVAVTVNITPAPTATALTFCGATTVANLTANGTSLKWYAAANGGTQLLSTANVTTGNYFVSQTLNNCESTRTQVAVTVNITPTPTATALTFCGATTVANLTANGTSLKWYATANGGTQLLATAAVTTGNYFVSQTLNNCESTRTQVAVTVNITPAPTATALTFCGATTVANLTTNGTALKWYAAANGGTQLISTASVTTGNYFVSQTLNNCESARTQVSVTVNITPAPTATTLQLNQGSTVANLTANGTSLKWYAAANGGTQLDSSLLLVSGSYFVSQTINGCESTRTEVIVTIINPQPPVAPVASAQTFCGATTVANLTANGTNLKWYAAANGGTQLTLTTSVITGTYYVSQTINNIESARTEVLVTVNVTPAPTASAQTFCQLAFAGNLTAEGTNIKWYDASTDGTLLTPNTPLTSGSYYVSQTINDCESVRTQVAVTINITPAPIASAAQPFCNNATVGDLTAEGTDLRWYSYPSSGQAHASTTPLVAGNYYVSQTLNDCESARTLVVVTITTPVMPSGTNQIFCSGAIVSDLSATVTGTNLKWFNAPVNGAVLAETALLSTGTYYVSQTVNGCESPRKTIQVTINTTAAPNGDTTQLFSENGKKISNLEVQGENIIWYASEADAIAGINPLPADTLLISETTYYATQTINGCESNEVLAVTVTIALGTDDFIKLSYKYYPNPVVNTLHIESSETITHITVYNLNGQEVINKDWNTQNNELDMSSLESAVYLVKINFGNTEKTIRVVKDKQ